jgi:hypothetical protein
MNFVVQRFDAGFDNDEAPESVHREHTKKRRHEWRRSNS